MLHLIIFVPQKGNYVIELSSFQLDNMVEFKADVAVLLNITPDHLDRYEFKLENYDPDWRIAGPEPLATYVKVPPGEYTFRVRATNAQGAKSDEKSIQIIISPPWWKTSSREGRTPTCRSARSPRRAGTTKWKS